MPMLLSNKAIWRTLMELLIYVVKRRSKCDYTRKKYDKMDEGFNYLIKMPMDSVTEENVVKLMKEL